MRIPQQQQPQESKPKKQQQQQHQEQAFTEQQRPGFDVDTNNIFPTEPYEFHRTPKKEKDAAAATKAIMSLSSTSPHHRNSSFHDSTTGTTLAGEAYAESSVAGASSQVTETDVCDSESYLAIHEYRNNNNISNNTSTNNNNNNNRTNNNSTRETISLNDSNERQQQQQQQQRAQPQQPDVTTTAIPMPITDATQVVHEMHLALLYLLSNPEEFQRALAVCRSVHGDDARSQQAKTLQEWNNEYASTTAAAAQSLYSNAHNADNMDNESLLTEHTDWQQLQQQQQQQSSKNKNAEAEAEEEESVDAAGTPLPFVVFADDAEVVLPQAHTASQLFGLERISGIELEAAAGLPALSQLFLRWLAIMPAGDHLNLIDPPGLTVMRIAGGRYRVTAAHRVVWTWMNEFVPLEQEISLLSQNQKQSSSVSKPADGTNGSSRMTSPSPSPPPPLGGEPIHQLQVGDLVTMTIVDVFETDNQGKLLSYCPTFDNRAVFKTHVTTETLRKSTTQALHLLGQARNSKLAHMVMRQAKRVANNLRLRVHQAVSTYSIHNNHNNNNSTPQNQNHSQQNAQRSPQPPSHAVVDLNLDDDDYYDNYNDDQEDDTSKALMEFRAAVAAEENSALARHRSGGGGIIGMGTDGAASSTYLADDDLERHEV